MLRPKTLKDAKNPLGGMSEDRRGEQALPEESAMPAASKFRQAWEAVKQGSLTCFPWTDATGFEMVEDEFAENVEKGFMAMFSIKEDEGFSYHLGLEKRTS